VARKFDNGVDIPPTGLWFSDNMEPQLACPVCGNKSLTRVFRKTMMSTSNRSENGTVLAYRCENGHLHIKRVNTAEDGAGTKAA
jgi:hypothetical protein